MNPAAAFPAGLRISTAADDCAVLSADIAGSGQAADAVLWPAHAEDVGEIVRIARREGIGLYPRGGGWSYTGGYRPQAAPSVMVDTALLQGIAIDRDAGQATAASGTSWSVLYDTLQAAGLRACSFGPLSGFGATLGGGAAQNGGFFGAAGHGSLGDGCVLASTMVAGSGEISRFGLADRVDGGMAPQPLVGDCGAFGIRTDVTLRIMPTPAVTQFASFDFPHADAALGVLAGLAGMAHLGEAYVFDPGSNQNLARSGFSVIESAGLAADLLGARGGLLGRLGGLLRTARAGKAFVAELRWSLHVSFDGDAAGVAAAMEQVAQRAGAAGGEIVPDVIPRVTRARPFRRIKALLGPDGESWLPVHGVFPAARGIDGLRAVQAVLAEADAEMRAQGVRCVMLAALMGGRMIVEPQLFWPDALSAVQRRMVTAEQLARFSELPARPDARTLAQELRARLIAALDGAGAAHFQIGRAYAAHPGVAEAAVQAWRELKRRLDPDRIMNPGALGV